MQLVPIQLKDILSQDVNITNPQEQELLTTNIVESIVQTEDLFPAEKADKLIWVLDMFGKEKAYWDEKLELAKSYVQAMENMEERLKKYIRFIMVDDEKWFGTDMKIVAKDYKKSIVDSESLQPNEMSYTIKDLDYEQYLLLKDIVREAYTSTSLPDDVLQSLVDKFTNSVVTKGYGVTKLGEDHPAVTKEVKRLIQVKALTQQELKSARS